MSCALDCVRLLLLFELDTQSMRDSARHSSTCICVRSAYRKGRLTERTMDADVNSILKHPYYVSDTLHFRDISSKQYGDISIPSRTHTKSNKQNKNKIKQQQHNIYIYYLGATITNYV